MKRLYALLSMLIRENFIPGSFERRPEESLVMDAEDQVAAWHQQGSDDGPIIPVYHLNAMACSRLAPAGSTVVDLGCGSGQFAAYLARCRPDLRIIGIDLSGPMVDVGNQALAEAGLSDRVELRQGDMTSFSNLIPAEIGLINCLFAIHHLPTLQHVQHCLAEIRSVSEKTACGIMIFDLARPRHKRTAYDYPTALTPGVPEEFRLDSINSLIAAYSHEELKVEVEQVFRPGGVRVARSRVLPLYQAFWQDLQETRDTQLEVLRNTGIALPGPSLIRYRALRAILPAVPVNPRAG